MALFKKNPNEAAYAGGKKHWADVIKNTGPGDLLIWRQPEEDFNTNSTLIVMPGEAAIFVKGGTIEQTFENGTYKLSTQNYPFISRLRNAFTGGISTFNCVVFFVKTAHTTELLWGTDSPIQVRDKMLGIATKLRARGGYRVHITDPAKFLEKILGNNYDACTPDGIKKFIRMELQSKIKSVIARAINESNTEILGIDSRLDELSGLIQPLLNETVSDYGLRCANFSIAAIDLDDSELRQKYDEIGMDAIAKIRNAQADKQVMDTLGNMWGQQQAVNIMSTMANNVGDGGNGMMNAAAGIGMGLATGNMFGNMAQQTFAPQQMPYGQPMQQPYGQPMQAAPQQPAAPAQEDPMETLGKLKKLLEAGLIEQSEYDAKKAEILSRL